MRITSTPMFFSSTLAFWRTSKASSPSSRISFSAFSRSASVRVRLLNSSRLAEPSVVFHHSAQASWTLAREASSVSTGVVPRLGRLVAGQVGQVLLGVAALGDGQLGEQLDQRRDGVGVAGLGQGEGGPQADGRLGVGQQLAQGVARLGEAVLAEHIDGGGPAQRRIVFERLEQGGVGLAVAVGHASQGGADFFLNRLVLGVGQEGEQRGGGAVGPALGGQADHGAGDGRRIGLQGGQAAPRQAGGVGGVGVLGGLAQRRDGRRADGRQLGGGLLALGPVFGPELFDEGGQAVGRRLAAGAEAKELQQAGPVHGQPGRLHDEFVGQDVVAVAGQRRPRRRQQQAGAE